MIWVAAGAAAVIGGAGLVALGLCRAAARGDRRMRELFEGHWQKRRRR